MLHMLKNAPEYRKSTNLILIYNNYCINNQIYNRCYLMYKYNLNICCFSICLQKYTEIILASLEFLYYICNVNVNIHEYSPETVFSS